MTGIDFQAEGCFSNVNAALAFLLGLGRIRLCLCVWPSYIKLALYFLLIGEDHYISSLWKGISLKQPSLPRFLLWATLPFGVWFHVPASLRASPCCRRRGSGFVCLGWVFYQHLYVPKFASLRPRVAESQARRHTIRAP